MNILFVSSLTSKRTIAELSAHYKKNLGFAVQKFNRLIVHGLIENQVTVQTLTGLPISRNRSNKLWWNAASEIENGINFKYIPFINYPGFRHICLFFYSFFYTLFWGLKGKKDKCIVCDVLNISICLGSLLASKLIGLKSVGVMTDMPGLMVTKDNDAKRGFNIISTINKSYLTSFSYYVFLTEQMNVAINKKHRPYIIMEGLVDESMEGMIAEKSEQKNNKKRILLYAGGLYARYGLKMLVDAFMQIKDEDLQLSLYGNGPFVEELKNYYCLQDSRIVYHGIVPNEQVVKAELDATLLINPRPTTEEFTQYSFPSKNMEYMVSGTPVLTTKLPGMPEEYYPYIYLLEDETVEGFAKSLRTCLFLPKEELIEKGKRAKRFVLENKNSISQTERIINLIKNWNS